MILRFSGDDSDLSASDAGSEGGHGWRPECGCLFVRWSNKVRRMVVSGGQDKGTLAETDTKVSWTSPVGGRILK